MALAGVAAGIAALAATSLGAGTAFAAAGPPVDSGHGIAATITNPAAATVTLGASTLAIDATVNTDVTHEAPTSFGSTGDGAQGQIATGGISIQVVSNNGTGYAVQADGPAAGFTNPSNPAMPNNDFHLSSVQALDGNGHPLINTTDLSSPATVLSSTTVSGSVWPDTNPTDPHRVAKTDEALVAAYIQPNVLIGGQTYTGTVEMFYVPNL
jgi:hypothetical protein